MRVTSTSRRRSVPVTTRTPQTEADVSSYLSLLYSYNDVSSTQDDIQKNILIVDSATFVTLHFSFNGSLQCLFKKKKKRIFVTTLCVLFSSLTKHGSGFKSQIRKVP